MSVSRPKNRAEALKLAANDLGAYAAAMWPRFELAPHSKFIIDELERVDAGLHDRAQLLIPPRHGKSLITSQIFTAWYLGAIPTVRSSRRATARS